MLSLSPENGLVFQRERCVQCGTCVGVCPHSALTVEYQEKTKYYDIVLDKEKCTLCGLCIRACPAAQLDKTPAKQEHLERAQGMYLAYARDENVRWMSSSGGVARSLLHFVLASGYVNAAYSLVYPDYVSLDDVKGEMVSDLTPTTTIARNIKPLPIEQEAKGEWLIHPPAYHAIPCSLYRPIMWGKGIGNIDRQWQRVLLIGLPCQIKSAKNYFSAVHPRIEVVAITIFCRKQKTFGYTQYIKRLLNARKAHDADVFYRGNGWPGNLGVQTTGGTSQTSFFYPARCWNLPGCQFCTDPLNAQSSDITLTDPWGIVRPSSDEWGQNLVIVWSIAGDDLFHKATEILASRPVTFELAKQSLHVDDIARKQSQIPARAKSQHSLSALVFQIWSRMTTKVAEALMMQFTHESRAILLAQTLKQRLLRHRQTHKTEG